MDIFRENITITSWGIIFLGLKKQWLKINEVFVFCETGNIECTEERLIQLYLVQKDSETDLFNLIKDFVIMDDHPPINWNEDSRQQQFEQIHKVYWLFWEIEFLLRIVNRESDKEKVLHEVAAIHPVFNYPDSWHGFIYFMPSQNNIPRGIDGLYSNLMAYIKDKLKLVKNHTFLEGGFG